MLSNFFVCYYAMGWVAEAINFALLPEYARNPIWPMTILLWPILLPLYIAMWAINTLPKIQKHQEYWWRSP